MKVLTGIDSQYIASEVYGEIADFELEVVVEDQHLEDPVSAWVESSSQAELADKVGKTVERLLDVELDSADTEITDGIRRNSQILDELSEIVGDLGRIASQLEQGAVPDYVKPAVEIKLLTERAADLVRSKHFAEIGS